MIFFNLKVKNAISLEDILSQYSVKDESERMAIEEAEAISRKAVLCGILKRVNKDSFDITLSFMEAIKIAGEFLDEFPEIKNVYCNENSYETDRQGLMLVIELYLAYRRMTERQRQGSRSVLAIDLFDEAQLLNRDSYDEMNDLTRLMYGLLRYKYDRDRITPFILEMAKESDKK